MMAIGPGRYDPEVTELRARLKADGVVLLVFGGERGQGFSAQLTFPLMAMMPQMLREMADEIERSGVRA
jgi:hypothetical protein